jgi:hypothetical protein
LLMAASAMEFPLIVLPVKFSGFYVTENNNDANLYWQNNNDEQVKQFEIQKNDGLSDYQGIGSILSNGTGTYHWTDMNYTSLGDNIFYRIKSVSKDGSADFSNTIVIKKKNGLKGKVEISPNPIKNGVFHLSLYNLPMGTYLLTVINNNGQVVFTKKIVHSGINSAQVIILPSNIVKGIDFIHISGEGYNIQRKISLE